MGYIWQRCRGEPRGRPWPREVSGRLLRYFSTTDTGNLFHSSFRRNSQQRPPSPQAPPALWLLVRHSLGALSCHSKWAFCLAPPQARQKLGRRCRSKQCPHSPQGGVSFLLASATVLSTPLKTDQTRARGVEILYRPEVGQGGFVCSPGAWRRLSGLALHLQPPHSAIALLFLATPCPCVLLEKDFYTPFILHENLNPHGPAFKNHRHETRD